MDQLKTFGLWLKKYYFWVSCGLLTLAALGVWFYTTGKLMEEAETRQSALKSSESSARQILSLTHPNDLTLARMEEINTRLVDDVYAAWQRQYDKQSQILTWPAQILGDDFINRVSKLQPIEAKVKFPATSEELSAQQRFVYRNFINLELPSLAKIIGADWYADQRTMTRQPMGAAAAAKEPIVLWSAGDQSNLERSRFSWPSDPTTLQVLYAQEDLWVMRAIMRIIKATNGDIEYRYQAAVKTIEAVRIGRDAVGLGGTVAGLGGGGGGQQFGMPAGAPGAGGDFDTDGAFPSSGAGAPTGIGGGGGTDGQISGSGGGATVDPGDNRYVDLKNKPLTAQQLRTAFDSKNPEDAFLMVAKRMPVRLQLRMDQRKLPKLLAECGNADLQLEVKQVRINRPFTSSSSSGLGGMGAPETDGDSGPPAGFQGPADPLGATAGGGGDASAGLSLGGGGDLLGGGSPGVPTGRDDDDGGGFFGESGPMGGGGGFSPMGNRTTAQDPYEVSVEIYGVIYIYNPVDREKLGKKLEEVPVEETTDTPEQQPTEPVEPNTAAG